MNILFIVEVNFIFLIKAIMEVSLVMLIVDLKMNNIF